MGDPEFEIITADRATSQGTFNREVQCAGDQAQGTNQPGIKSADFVYDQNHTSWEGLVQLATLQQMAAAQAIDNGAIFMVWEDDNTPCRIRRGNSNTRQKVESAAAAVNGARAFQQKNGLDQILAAVALLFTAWDLLSALNQDDFVGLLVVEEEVGQNTALFTHAIVNENGTIVGKANIIVVP